MPTDCTKLNAYLFRRVPDFDKDLVKDRFPISTTYSNFYPTDTWPSGTGVQHTWDRVHVTMPNDTGCWQAKEIDACLGNPCAPAYQTLGIGSTRSTYTKYGRVYRSPVWCLDMLRDYEEFQAQMAAYIEGFKPLPDQILSNFLRKLSLRQADRLYIAGSANTQITVTPTLFTNADCTILNLGSPANLPTSRMTMNYLNHKVDPLTYNGYFNRQFDPTGMFMMTSDEETRQYLAQANPQLAAWMTGKSVEEAGKFYAFGLSLKVGNWGFKADTEQLRFQHIGGGLLQQVFPYENVPTTVGKRPEFSTTYQNARYAAYHVYNKAARRVLIGDITPVNPEMKFNTARSLMGKWQWYTPDMFQAADPCTGTVCTYENHKHNQGFFEAEFEIGMQTKYPEIEHWVIAQREPTPVIDVPACAADPGVYYQDDLYPYNCSCQT